jgi:predicted ATP-dependent endonuclease of OLD family
MRINKIRIKNYRSIKSEIVVDFEKHTTILGPNNSGKTNFLKAVFLFFEAFKNNTYSVQHDLPFGIKGAQTSIAISFFGDRKSDNKILEKYYSITDFLEGEKEAGVVSLTLYLSFSPNGNPIYRFFTNDKVKENKRDDYRRLQDELVHEFLDNFSCKYIPSEKSSSKIYEDFLLPHMRGHIGNILDDQKEKVTKAFSLISSNITESLSTSGLENITCVFELPEDSFSNALSNFDFFIDDGEKTQYYRKGSGIQAAAVLACFKWISECEMKNNKEAIWLIEEPESYLHPALTESCKRIIQNLSSVSDVFTTTHSIGFIPNDHEKVLQTSYNKEIGTTFNKFKGYAEATQSIRKALGIKFSDYYNLSEFNLFVEGKTDKLIIENLLSIIKPKGTHNKLEFLRKASVMDFTGTSSLKDFLKSTYAFMSKERSIVVIFDGDEAGFKASKELTSYFGNKNIGFHSNQEYIILPNRLSIEALFPEEWLEELEKTQPEWLRIERDTDNKIIDLNLKSDKKVLISEWLIKKANAITSKNNGTFAWASEFIKVFNRIDDMLETINNKNK